VEVSEVRNEPPSSPPMTKTTQTDAEARGEVSEREEGEREQAGNDAKDDGGATAADLCVMSMNEEEGESEGEEEDEYSDCDPNQFCEISMDSKLEVSGSTYIGSRYGTIHNIIDTGTCIYGSRVRYKSTNST
jgi:hypothetical protein